MWRSNSSFTPTSQELEYLEGVRRHALEASLYPVRNDQDGDLREDLDEALRLARETRDELDAQRHRR